MMEQLDGNAKDAIMFVFELGVESFSKTLTECFPHLTYQTKLVRLIWSGEVFIGVNRYNVIVILNAYLAELKNHIGGIVALAEATHQLLPTPWSLTNLSAQQATFEDMQTALVQIGNCLRLNMAFTANLFGKASQSTCKSQNNVVLCVQPQNLQPEKQQAKLTKTQRRRMRQNQKLKLMKDELHYGQILTGNSCGKK
ncbi:hypothetical protein LPJ73_003669 [Coemansia sp. RSA 2703]|nr:hypothetical protein LPJ73_003669 [Coemansia sp. RSA 2703]